MQLITKCTLMFPLATWMEFNLWAERMTHHITSRDLLVIFKSLLLQTSQIIMTVDSPMSLWSQMSD